MFYLRLICQNGVTKPPLATRKCKKLGVLASVANKDKEDALPGLRIQVASLVSPL